MTLVDRDFLLCILHSLTHVVLLRLAGCNGNAFLALAAFWQVPLYELESFHFVVHVQWCRRSAAVGTEAHYLA